MARPEPVYDPVVLEEEARGTWKARQLPPAGGTVGPREGPTILQFEGTFTPGDPEALIAHRAVAADVEARSVALAGRRVVGTLRFEDPSRAGRPPAIGPILDRLGIWTGGSGPTAWDSASRHARVEALVGRLAHLGILVSRDLPFRACPVCAAPRSPERIIYQEEEGDAYLVRFDLSLDGRPARALVWVDAPWRLLGTSALLVGPDLPYVLARYRRGGSEELVLTSRSSLKRFHDWIPRGTFEVLEEHPGRFFEGKPYDYPLRHEFPTGGSLNPPGGTILAVPEVTDTGTGIVPLVPGHGSTDAEIAESRGVAGWPLITPRGQLDLTLMHKYSGLDLATGSEFILRDLEENEAIFAHLRVRRGVPHCAVCGSALLWIPGRAWCLEPSRFPPERRADYVRLLPGAPALDRIEVAPWPVSAASRPDDPEAVALLECSRCERLEALAGPVACPCGARRYPVRRRLVPSATGALSAWARFDPFPLAASIRLYVGERRRVPTVVHHLMASAGLDGEPGDLGLTQLPTISDVSLAELLTAHGADAVRSAYVRTSSADRASGSFPERCRIERDRLARLWSIVGEVLADCEPGMHSTLSQPIAGYLGELETEDLALLARWERIRVLALADYDRFDPASVHHRIVQFLDTDLAVYRRWVRPRLGLSGAPPPKRSALRALFHVFRSLAMLLGPIAPHTAEALWRRLTTGRTSLFEGSFPPVERTLLNDDLCAAWDRWRSVVRAAGEFRRGCHIAAEAVIPTVTLVVGDDELGDKLRTDRPVLERLARISRLDIGSPREPWTGRQGRYRPVESEIQRLYPSQATLISHLLARTPPRGMKGGSGPGELSVAIQGETLKILPTMVEYVETLPPGILPHPWRFGEMYLALPLRATAPSHIPPPLSRDAYWLVRRIELRLHRTHFPTVSPAGVAIIAAVDPLLSELRGQAEAIARFLGLAEVRVTELAAERPAGRLSGRTRTGSTWWVDIPGIGALPERSKHRIGRPQCRRVPSGPPVAPAPEADLGTDEVIDYAQSVRALGAQLDELLGVPVLGPSKIATAWETGLTSIEAYRAAEFDQLVAIPGFGPAIASRLLVKFGKTPPPAHALRAHRPASSATGSRSRGVPIEAPTPPAVARPSLGATVSTSVVAPEPVPASPPAPFPTEGAEERVSSPPTTAAPETPPESGVAPEAPTKEIASTPEAPLILANPPRSLVPAAPEVAPALELPPTSPAPSSESVEATPEETPTPSSIAPEVAPAPAEPVSPAPPSLELAVPAPEPTPPETSAEGEAPAEVEMAKPIPEAAGPSLLEPSPSAPLPPADEPLPPVEASPITPAPTELLTEPAAPAAEEKEATALPLESVPSPEPIAEGATPTAELTPVMTPAELSPMAEKEEGEAESQPPVSETSSSVGSGTPSELVPETEGAPAVPETPPAAGLAVPVESNEAAPTAGIPEEAPSETPPAPTVPEMTAEPAPPVSESPAEAGVPEPEVPEPSEPVAGPVTPEPLEPVPEPEGPELTEVVPPVSPGEPEPTSGPAVPMPTESSVPPPEVVPPSESPIPSHVIPPRLIPEPTAPPEPPVPPPKPIAVAPPPAPSGIELEIGSSPFTSLQPFLDATAAGHRGICLVRESPQRIAAQVGPRPVDVYWLTNLGRGKTLRPSDLPGIFALLERAVQDDHVTALFLEGVEYLVRIHGIEELLGRLSGLNELAKAHDARVWVHLTPDLLHPHDLERISAALRAPPGS